MAVIERRVSINAPADLVYRVSQDYSVRYEWDPFPENISVVSGDPDVLAIGTRVHVKSRLGMNMLVEFVQLMPPTRAAVTMVQGPWFLAKFAGSWIFESDVSGTRTEARFRYMIAAKPAPLHLIIEPLALLYFSRVVSRRLAGLKAYCEKRFPT
ncbi:type II toxin-antitoxin system RatA family toxin [Pseudoduganella violaceinigra]|uniref:type II toxin-antitoxin system RatA family toxin n=1 Tax=Pseudoduganella violaceinigra TaxID=246602 RepID=UPI000483A411|nr:SRPBCC family protein [Pseudoduganella violaceinigra]